MKTLGNRNWLVALMSLALMSCMAFGADAPEAGTAQLPKAPMPVVSPPVEPEVFPEVGGLKIMGGIQGTNVRFDVAMEVTVSPKVRNRSVTVAAGEVTLLQGAKLDPGVHVVLGSGGSYRVELPDAVKGVESASVYKISLPFAVRPRAVDGLLEATFEVPEARVRELELVSDRTDLEVTFPDAMRVERKTLDGKLHITAVEGAGRPFVVKWKPHVEKLADAKLVVSSEGNAVVRVDPGTLRADSLFMFEISQGKMNEVRFRVPAGLSITQVKGANLRDWAVEPPKSAETDKTKAATSELRVTLSSPVVDRYAVEVVGEMPVGKFPADVATPVLEPIGVVRSSGQVAVGTDSAVQLVVKQAAGISQVEPSAFARIDLTRDNPRLAPARKVFFYSYASTPYELVLGLDDMVPALDASEQMVVNVKEEDISADAALEVDVRDAAIRSLVISTPAGFVASNVTGAQVLDFSVFGQDQAAPGTPAGAADGREITVNFRQPVMGRVLIGVRMEIGRSPLGKTWPVSGVRVKGAKNERGYVVVSAEGGVEVEATDVKGLGEVRTGATTLKVGDAQLAYRFREAGWSFGLVAKKRISGVRAEAFELISLGESAATGMAVFNYFITGSPVDELTLTVPAGLQSVEFVGKDVRIWKRDPANPSLWNVKLQRKVIGDYSLGMTFSQKYGPDAGVPVGGLRCEGASTQTGYVVVSSHLNLKLSMKGAIGNQLMEVDREELPATYRLLVSAPILMSLKYVGPANEATLGIEAFERGSLLPVVIEVLQLETSISVDKDGANESVTKARYEVKNATGQFLTLTLPKGARLWSTRMANSEQNNGELQRVSVSYDAATGKVLAALPRLRNPNAPVTVELEYGQVVDYGPAGRAATPGGAVVGATEVFTIAAPECEQKTTFVNWLVEAPAGWAILSGAGTTMPMDARENSAGNLGKLMFRVGQAWSVGFQNCVTQERLIVTIVIALAFAAVVLWTVPRLWWRMLLVLAMGIVAAIGMVGLGEAGGSSQLAIGDDWRSMHFSQPIDLEQSKARTLALRVVKAESQYAPSGVPWTLIGIGAGCVVAGLAIRVVRWVLLGVAAALFAAVAAEFSFSAAILAHALTWGVPLAVTLAWLVQLAVAWWRRPKSPASGAQGGPAGPVNGTAGAVVLLVMISLWMGGCAAEPGVVVTAKKPTIESVSCLATVEKDSVAVTMKAHVATPEPARFNLFGAPALLLSGAKISEITRVERTDGRDVLVIDKAGEYDITLKYLWPLSPAGADGLMTLKLPMVLATMNQFELTIPGTQWDVKVPGAGSAQVDASEADGVTKVAAVLLPGEGAEFDWRPKRRQPTLEKTVFYAQVTSAWYADAGFTEGRHLVQYQIAQGELSELHLAVPENTTVTAVEGADLGTWRFDPAAHEVEARLSRPATGDYRLMVSTQVSMGRLPSQVKLSVLGVKGAERQRGSMGILCSSAVNVMVESGPAAMSVEDFAREASGVLATLPRDTASAGSVRAAFQASGLNDVVTLQEVEILPEIRTTENAVFTVADDRLVYNGQITVDVAKAGTFTLNVRLPEGYDIDALGSPEVGHWDEEMQDGRRVATIHLNKKLLGSTVLNLSVSKPVTELPKLLTAPRIEVVGSVKHSGQMVISSDRGVRLSVSEREGVSEVNPLELDIRTTQSGAGVMAYRLLGPMWKLTVSPEVIEPRVNVEFLHVARVSEGLVRHTHYLRYRVHNAGVRTLELQTPKGALGLVFSGPDVVRKEEIGEGSGHWKVELGSKWFERPYPLTVQYETRLDRGAKGGAASPDGGIAIQSVKPLGVEMAKGYMVVYSTERVSVEGRTQDASLQEADARSAPRDFGVGDLSSAALCYRASSADYGITLVAERHDTSALVDAEALETSIQTVVTDLGESMTRVGLKLRVANKQQLQATLPTGSRVWSLFVNGKPTTPALAGKVSPGVVAEAGTATGTGKVALLIPLGQSASGEQNVDIELVYVTMYGPIKGEAKFAGPEFDLPMRNISWKVYVPDGMSYEHFTGTLGVDESTAVTPEWSRYNIGIYENLQKQVGMDNSKLAVELQNKANSYSSQGMQEKAKDAFQSAWYYSRSDAALNEDTRVQLRALSEQQALAGIVGARARLRQQVGLVAESGGGGQMQDMGDRFSQADVDRVRNSLNKPDSENLELITTKMVEVQEEAAGALSQLAVTVPLHGRVMSFARELQVTPGTPMEIGFTAKTVAEEKPWEAWAWAAGLGAAIGGLWLGTAWMWRRIK